MKTEDSMSYQEFIQELKQYCTDKQSGTLYFIADNHHPVLMTIDEGEIVSCSFEGKKNYDALPLIKNIKGGTRVFVKGVFNSMEEVSLPNTAEVLSLLSGDTASLGKPAYSSISANTQLNAAAKLVETELAKFIGPVASLVCEDYIMDQGGTINELDSVFHMIDVVSAEISDPGQQIDFRQTILERVKTDFLNN